MTARQDSSTVVDIDLAAQITRLLTTTADGLVLDEIQAHVGRRRQAVIATLHQLVAAGRVTAHTEPVRGKRSRIIYQAVATPPAPQGTPGNGTAVRPSHCDRVLARLRRGPATHHELYQLGVIVHSRIADLRRRGHRIECDKRYTDPSGNRAYRYTLHASAAAIERQAA